MNAIDLPEQSLLQLVVCLGDSECRAATEYCDLVRKADHAAALAEAIWGLVMVVDVFGDNSAEFPAAWEFMKEAEAVYRDAMK